MSSTDELEEDLRAMFGRAAASVPPPADLTSRATTGAHHARRRAWAVSAAAAVGVAAVAITAFALGGPDNQPAPSSAPPVAGPGTVPTSAPTISAAAAAGTWQPLRMGGAPNLKAPRPQSPTLVLQADGTWSGSDGCNSLGGTYTIGAQGEFTAKIGPQRLVGCENVPHTDVLAKAKRVTLEGDSLRFYAPDGRELAAYVRTR